MAAQQVAKLAWGAVTLGATHPPLWRKLAPLAAAVAPAAGPWEATSLMWALARARCLEGDAAAALSARALALAPRLGPADIANAAWALGAAGERPRALLPALAVAAAAAAGRMAPEEAAAVAWGFARLWGARRVEQQRGRAALLPALAEAAARLAPEMGVRQAATAAWGLAVLAGPAGARDTGAGGAAAAPAAGGEGGAGGPPSVHCVSDAAAAAAAAWGSAGALLDRAVSLGLQGAAVQEACMLLYTVAKGTAAAEGGVPGEPEPAARRPDGPARARRERVLRQVALWALAAPAEALPPDAVATLLWAFKRAGYFEAETGGGAGAEDADGAEREWLRGELAAALASRAAALAAAARFSPQQLPRAAAGLAALAAHGDASADGGSKGDPLAPAAAEAREALGALALPAAAVVGRLKLRALADVACAYAAAGLHPEELFDAISEVSCCVEWVLSFKPRYGLQTRARGARTVYWGPLGHDGSSPLADTLPPPQVAQRPRALRASAPWERARLLWAFAAAGHPDERLFSVVTDALAAWLPHALHPGALARLAWACAVTGYDDDSLLEAVAARAATEKFLAACQPRDAAALAWALAAAGAKGAAAAAGALAARGAGMLEEGRLAPAQLGDLCWGAAAAGAYEERLLAGVARWVCAAGCDSEGGSGDRGADSEGGRANSSGMLPPLAQWAPKDAAAVAWSLATSRHCGGGAARALLALAARCGGAAGGGGCSAEDACRAAWAVAWSGLLLGGSGGGTGGSSASGGAADRGPPAAVGESQEGGGALRAEALQLVRRLVQIALDDLDDLEASDLAWLAWTIATSAAAAAAGAGPPEAANHEAAAQAEAAAQLARVHACAAGWGPGVFSALDAQLLYVSHEWLRLWRGAQGAAAARSGGGAGRAASGGVEGDDADEALPARVLSAGAGSAWGLAADHCACPCQYGPLSICDGTPIPAPSPVAGKRALVRQAAAARGSDFCVSLLGELRAVLAGGDAISRGPTLKGAAAPSLPEAVASSARGRAQLEGLSLEHLLPQITVELEGGGTVYVVLARTVLETRPPPAAACGWAAAAAQVLAAAAAWERVGGRGGGARVAVLLESEWQAREGAGRREWLVRKLRGL